jgi:hypothetical protein
MAGKEQIAIDRKLTLEEINSLIRHENNSKISLLAGRHKNPFNLSIDIDFLKTFRNQL